MRSLAFNSVENEFCENFGGSQDLAKWRVNNADGFYKKDQKSIRYECVYRQSNGFGWKSTHKTLLINTISSACTWIEGNLKPSIQHLQLKKALSHLRFN